MDFKDLNRACPKDELLLPFINRLIDATVGHEMYRYVVYNQIKIDPINAEKIAFRTSLSNFTYKVMPFGLKNSGATY